VDEYHLGKGAEFCIFIIFGKDVWRIDTMSIEQVDT
jgi:hypothetical protein